MIRNTVQLLILTLPVFSLGAQSTDSLAIDKRDSSYCRYQISWALYGISIINAYIFQCGIVMTVNIGLKHDYMG